jgi:G3E family GTPase
VIPATLVTGTSAAAREAAIAAALTPDVRTAIILEGMPDANSGLDAISSRLQIARIAPGCICCTGNLTMRVTLNRLLRAKPEQLYIGLATSAHLAQVRTFLSAAPYDNLLTLTKDLHA